MASEVTALILGSLARELKAYLRDVEDDARQILDRDGINYTEGTRTGLFHDAEVVGYEVEGVVGSTGPGALFAHEGRGKNKKMPPDAVIRQWLRVKKGVPEGRELDRATFLVRRAIGRRGIRGKKFLQRPLDLREPTKLSRLRAAVLRDLEGVDLFPNLRAA
jgi:hypothetical protein